MMLHGEAKEAKQEKRFPEESKKRAAQERYIEVSLHAGLARETVVNRLGMNVKGSQGEDGDF